MRNKSDHAKKLMGDIGRQVNQIMITERATNMLIDRSCGVSSTTVCRMRRGRDVNLSCIIRVLDVMGYAISITRIPGTKPIMERPESQIIIKKIKLEQVYAKRKERGQHLNPNLPPRGDRIRKPGRPKGYFDNIKRKEAIQEAKSKAPLFKPFGGEPSV